MSNVLFDAPGPKARARQRIFTIVGAVVVAVIVVAVILKLNSAGQFEAKMWDPFINPNVVRTLVNGLINTIIAAILSIILSLIFGAVFGAMRVSALAPLRWISTIVVELFRAIPLVLLILFVFLAYSQDMQKFFDATGLTDVFDSAGLSKNLGALASLVVGLTLYNGSVLAEIFRAGINSVPKGQREAAMSIGMRSGQTLRLILAPQAIRTMLPAIVSQAVVALKDTSLGFIIAYEEFVRTGQLIAANPLLRNYIPMAIVLMTVYVAINYSLSKFANYLSTRQRRTTKLAPVNADQVALPGTAETLVDSAAGNPPTAS